MVNQHPFFQTDEKSLGVKLKNTVVTVVVDVIVSLSLTVKAPLNKSSKPWLLLLSKGLTKL